MISSVVSEWIPSSPDAISSVPPFIVKELFEWIESSEESILIKPPSITISFTAFIAFALEVSSVEEELPPQEPQGVSLLDLLLLFTLPPYPAGKSSLP